jgi:hypothetical protein
MKAKFRIIEEDLEAVANSASSKKDIQIKISKKDKKNAFPSYPHYPVKDDIYNREKEEDIDPEFPFKIKKAVEETEDPIELDFNNLEAESELDVPGSELDDEQEDIGSEDEENNYYSIGGDNHSDLDENKGRMYN